MKRISIIVLLCCWGCGKNDSLQRAAVGGKVTLDGAAIVRGTISFYPSGNTKGPASGGPIEDGAYSIIAEKGPAIGDNRVEIHATKKTGRKVQAPMASPGVMTDEIVEAIPAHYNVASTLVVKIQPGKNVFDCELTSLTSR